MYSALIQDLIELLGEILNENGSARRQAIFIMICTLQHSANARRNIRMEDMAALLVEFLESLYSGKCTEIA
jgi:hypothetical protein